MTLPFVCHQTLHVLHLALTLIPTIPSSSARPSAACAALQFMHYPGTYYGFAIILNSLSLASECSSSITRAHTTASPSAATSAAKTRATRRSRSRRRRCAPAVTHA